MDMNVDLTVVNNKWTPRSSTNLYKPPRVLKFAPSEGYYNDTFSISIQPSSIMNVDLLNVSFDSYFTTTCRCTLDNASNSISINTYVPDPKMISCSDLSRVPIFLALIENNSILDCWFIGYFSYSKKRLLSDFVLEETKQSKLSSQQRTRRSAFMQYLSFANNDCDLSNARVPYIGLPPTQPSFKSKEYFKHVDYQRNIDFQAKSVLQDFKLNDKNSIKTTLSQPPHNIIANTDSILMSPIDKSVSTSSSASSSSSYSIPTISSSLAPPFQSPLKTTAQPISIIPLDYNYSRNLINNPTLIIEDSLKNVIREWDPSEWTAQRRLVQFFRRQEDNNIICRFQTLYGSSPTIFKSCAVVSCIYWKEKQDFFITSFDCIALLEYLLGVTFTIEEKNRVRRNLEAYRPWTVSKNKETTTFFRLIMEFSDPKPRKIEKDIKVFSWHVLGDALKKISAKFTASYSSITQVNV